MTIVQTEPTSGALDLVSDHVLALRMTLRDMASRLENDPSCLSATQVLAECDLRTHALADATADATSLLRDAHSLDPVTMVTPDAQKTATSLVTAFLLDQEAETDNQILSSLLEELFTTPHASYRQLAAVFAALARTGAILASCGDELSPHDALAHMRECLGLS